MELRDESFKEYVAERQRERLRGLTENQAKYLAAMETSTVTICTGPAGTGKTYMACGLAAQMLQANRIERIVITRPLVSCGKGYGFRPGTVEEKVGPDMRPMVEALEEFLGASEVARLMREKVIEMWPLDDMRGANIPNTFIICDEAQNAEIEQLRMLLTRFAKGSRLVVCGDASQTDLKHGGPNPLLEVIRRFRPNCHPDIRIMRLTRQDIVRHPLLQWIDERFDGPAPADEEYHSSESEMGPAPSYPHADDDGWRDIACPACTKTIFFEYWAQEDNLLVECFHCRACVELLDEQDRLNPAVVDEEPEYCTRDVKTP